ncbi:MAG: hypothetical protein EOO03_03495 [Chitinophagaceae bacterium]|nr:MAG: hypothetical protein EOO03_03495 [Chitinophagaceae bacterium]
MILLLLCTAIGINSFGQASFNLKYKRSAVYAGIEVGSKGVKMTVIEIEKKADEAGNFNSLKDSSVNTDFISFNEPSFAATLNALTGLYQQALGAYKIPSANIFTVMSSGVKVLSEKDNNKIWVNKLTDSFRNRINEPQRSFKLVSVQDEARLSHLGIVPETKRFSTFLIDIGSGNTKGGYFPNVDISSIRLFDLTWGTKSVANATEKRMENDLSLANYRKQLFRVLEGAANQEIVYAINVSGAYNMSDNIAFSGGIAWALANLIHPELNGDDVVPVTYKEVEQFYNRIYENAAYYSPDVMVTRFDADAAEKKSAAAVLKNIQKVFDQKALMAGTGLLLRIMRQFEGVYEQKQFYMVKNGQVGWISAYVDQQIVSK